MKFLIDNALSPALSNLLSAAGHDSVHVRDRQLQHADDEKIFEAAVAEERIVISADTDFGTLSSFSGSKRVSVILFRHPSPRRPEQQADCSYQICRPLKMNSRRAPLWFCDRIEFEYGG